MGNTCKRWKTKVTKGTSFRLCYIIIKAQLLRSASLCMISLDEERSQSLLIGRNGARSDSVALQNTLIFPSRIRQCLANQEITGQCCGTQAKMSEINAYPTFWLKCHQLGFSTWSVLHIISSESNIRQTFHKFEGMHSFSAYPDRTPTCMPSSTWQ